MANTLPFVFGILGNIASVISFATPLGMFRTIYRGKSVFEYRSLPFVVSLLSQLTWLYYGCMLQRGAIFIIVVSAIGVFFQTAYLIVYLVYAGPQLRMRTALLIAVVDFVIFAAIFVSTFVAIPASPIRSVVVGWSCVVTTMANFGAPLSVMWQVIQTRRVESMPIALSIALIPNAGIWLAYGIVTHDLYIMIPNVVGLILAGVQISLYCYYSYLYQLVLHFWQQFV